MVDILLAEHQTVEVKEGEYILQGDALRILRENSIIPLDTLAVTGTHVEFTNVDKPPKGEGFHASLGLIQLDAEIEEQTVLSVISDKENGDDLNEFRINRDGKDVQIYVDWIRNIERGDELRGHETNYLVRIKSQKKVNDLTVELEFNEDGLIYGINLVDGEEVDYIYVDEKKGEFYWCNRSPFVFASRFRY